MTPVKPLFVFQCLVPKCGHEFTCPDREFGQVLLEKHWKDAHGIAEEKTPALPAPLLPKKKV